MEASRPLDDDPVSAAMNGGGEDAWLPGPDGRIEQIYRRVVETASEGIWLFDADGVVVFANGVMSDILGVPVDRMLGRSIFEIIDRRTSRRIRNTAADRRAGVGERYDWRFTRADGTEVWVLVSATPVIGAEGSYQGTLAMVTDITARKQAEEALRRAETKYRSLFELNPRPMWVFDVETLRFLDVNQAAVEHYGYSREEFLEMSIVDIRPSEDVGDLLLDLADDARDGRGLWRHITKGGRRIEVEIYAQDVEVDGRSARLVLADDVTDQRRAEAALRESEERFRAVFAHAPVGQTLASLDGRFAQVNPAYCEMTGFSERELLQMGWRDLFPPELAAGEDELLRDLLEGRIPVYQVERPYLRPDGRRSFHLINVSLVRGVDGEPRFTEGLVLDITDRKKAEQSLRDLAARQEVLVDLSRRSLTTTDVETLIREALGALASTLDLPYTALADVSADGSFTPRAGTGWPPEVIGRRIPIDAAMLASRVAATGVPIAVEDYERDERYEIHPFLAANGIRSSAVVPIDGSATRRSVLAVHSDIPRVFEADEIAFIQAVGDLLAHAIQRAEAAGELQRNIETLRQTDRERRTLLSRIVSVQEEERSRIAGDIHDDSVQVMTALGMQLHAFSKRLTSEEDLVALARAEDVLRMTVQRLRHLMFDLRPPALDRVGFAAALRDYLDNMRSETGVECRFENRLTNEPSTDAAIVLYRIAQEALNNVRKHAGAGEVRVLLEDRSGGVFVRIEDDGRGFKANRILGVAHGHLGLTSMRERAELAGGWCKVRSSGGGGTVVQFWIPSDVGPSIATGVPA